MSKTLTASDRSALIRLASSLEKGSDERKAILAGLEKAWGKDRAWTTGRGTDSTLHITTTDGQSFEFPVREMMKKLGLPYKVGTRADLMPVVSHYIDDDLWHTLKGVLVLRDQSNQSRVAINYEAQVDGGGVLPWRFEFKLGKVRVVAKGKRLG